MTASGLLFRLVVLQRACGYRERGLFWDEQWQSLWKFQVKLKVYSFYFAIQSTKEERINKETGELTASGELSISELKAGEEESSCKSCQLPQGLSDQLKELEIHACSSPKQTRDHVPLEQKEELLDKVLPLYIQVM